MYKIIIVGTGNLAWHLASALEEGGNRVVGVYGRRISSTQTLVRKLFDAQTLSSLDFQEMEVDIVLVAVSDKAYTEVLEKINLPKNTIIAHTSGTLPLDILKKFPQRGVFYPLQSISKEKKLQMRSVPLCLEANHSDILDTLTDLAASISDFMYDISSEERQKIHIAAVFASNFTNHLLAVAKDILDQNNIEFEILYPLIQETIQKALKNSPASLQTGPAVRGDEQVLKTHLAFLKNSPYQKIYEVISQDIRRWHKK